MSHKIRWEPSGVYAHFDGLFSPDENEKASVAIYDDPRVVQIKYIIWDLSGIELQLMNDDDAISSAAGNLAELSNLKGIKMAFIAVDDLTIVLCKRFIEYSQRLGLSWEFQLFDNEALARNWVSL